MAKPPRIATMQSVGSSIRIDLHCHSEASSLTAETVLNAIHCPECYSDPLAVHAQAKRRGMDLVTITDHDTIAGVERIGHLPDVLSGEELTCWFPEDACKMHVLVYGISADQHARLQGMARDIYQVAAYLEEERIAHAVAHPIYRQNDRLERWHLERLLLLFKGFEVLNGAHSPLHREAFEPLLEWLDRAQMEKLSARHDLAPRWPEPWVKARTGGSDDHGLLNIGRTWTTFPPEVDTPAKVLEALRTGRCRPGGESGSSAKLAHTFYSVAVRYYSRHIMTPGMKANFTTRLLQSIVGEKPAPSKLAMVKTALGAKMRKIARAVVKPFARRKVEVTDSTTLLKRLFLTSFRDRLGDHPQLREALDAGLPPLGEHDEMLRLINAVNRDVTEGLAAAINRSVDQASFTGLFDSIAAILAQQFVLSPYYFSLFHQNKERHLLRKITGQPRNPSAGFKVGLFTDTFDEINGVGRFLRDMGEQAGRAGCSLTVHTCVRSPQLDLAYRKNFTPLLTWPLLCYADIALALPPVLEVLEWADRQQFDAIHVSTPGPMGLCGMLAGAMLRVPLLATYHTDFPAYADKLTGDHRVANGTRVFVEWFYRRAVAVFSRSRAYEMNLRELGVQKMQTLAAGVDTRKFSPDRRDETVWGRLGVSKPVRLLYCGRISREKNLDLLVQAFRLVCAVREDVALVLVGEGPDREELEKKLRHNPRGTPTQPARGQSSRQPLTSPGVPEEGCGIASQLVDLPVHFLGTRSDEELAAIYATSDLLVFPSTTDTLGQVVLEAQASGLPALVSTIGGPRELVEDGITGRVIGSMEPKAWADLIVWLVAHEGVRREMGESAARRAKQYDLSKTFLDFWSRHVTEIEKEEAEETALESNPAGQL